MEFVGFRNRRRKNSSDEDFMSGVKLNFCNIVDKIKGKRYRGIDKVFYKLEKCETDTIYRKRFRNS
jgi:hypothetical protein